jgi:FkbM family methyltransferase
MMRLGGLAKKILFGSVPVVRGRFPYYGHTVHFPLGSCIFEAACREGIYERDLVNLILSVVQPDTTYFDIGANIGLLSLPVLATQPTTKVVSLEPSPDVLPFLTETAKTSGCENWTVLGTAVGAMNGEAEFWTGGAANSAFDGLRDTGRGGAKRPVRVPVRPLDMIWKDLNRPSVSVIKIDIEGGEYFALQGATNLISSTRPTIFIEWFADNLRPYGVQADMLLTMCSDIGYSVYSVPSLAPVTLPSILRMAMAQTWTFALVPETQRVEITVSQPQQPSYAVNSPRAAGFSPISSRLVSIAIPNP